MAVVVYWKNPVTQAILYDYLMDDKGKNGTPKNKSKITSLN
jgi:hypothetical protein